MKLTALFRLQKLYFFFLIFFLMFHVVCVAQPIASHSKLISFVDCSLNGSQKYVLRVDDKPFYMTNIQVRLDKLKYNWGWNQSAREAIIEQAASDGFNTVSIPIHWYEVEPTKDHFDWTILDEYLSIVAKNNIRMELLWFSQNSGGQVQWISSTHLRVPDYVLYSPGKGSSATTSEFSIRRDLSDYTMDLNDKKLLARETYILSKVMEHIVLWDKENGSKHTVIGVQLGNEVTGYDFNGETFTSAQVISYLNQLGYAVKNSPYSVWTRVNCVWGMENGRIEVNEALRSVYGSGIDFVGIDLYKASLSIIRTVLPYKGLNYRMIMECEAEVSNTAQVQLAALSGNNAYNHYDMCGPDTHGLYDRDKNNRFIPHGKYIEEVRVVNKLLNSDIVDVAVNANGYGLFVHNWAGNSKETTHGVDGIKFSPKDSTSQAISIHRSNKEIVLMNTKGGTFNFPDSIGITGATKGYFDGNNNWVNQGEVAFTSTSISAEAGLTMRLTRHGKEIKKESRYQAEFASYGLGSFVESAFLGFAGNGYVNLNAKDGVIHWTKVDGQNGRTRMLRFRYANGGKNLPSVRLIINGSAQYVSFPPTDSWESYKYVTLNVELKPGLTNSVRMEAIGEGAGNIDELQIF
jgi:hypothetical protein